MSNTDYISVLFKIQEITLMTDEQICAAASISQWILESVKTGKVKNEVTISKILAGVVKCVRKKKGYAIRQLASATSHSNETIEKIEKGESKNWSQYLDCIEKINDPQNFVEAKTNSKNAEKHNKQEEYPQKKEGKNGKLSLNSSNKNKSSNLKTILR